MNYQTYRGWRDEVLRNRKPRRFDCMNPEMALAHLRPSIQLERDGNIDEVLALWTRATGRPLRADACVAGSGVRSILDAIFCILNRHRDVLWLPSDVYPAYWELSQRLRREPFSTLPQIDWSFLERTGQRDALLLPDPLSPEGRTLSAAELSRLRQWLSDAPERLLIVDSAYEFAAGVPELLDPGQSIRIWSMSKPWLSRGLLGVATVPAHLRDDVQRRLAAPAGAALGFAGALLASAPNLPGQLASRFAEEWARLAPEIRESWPDWEPPVTGYFSTLPVAFDRLLNDHNMLAVPGAVFGSERADLSIITCLHSIEMRDRLEGHA
jgi:hypothetical protein